VLVLNLLDLLVLDLVVCFFPLCAEEACDALWQCTAVNAVQADNSRGSVVVAMGVHAMCAARFHELNAPCSIAIHRKLSRAADAGLKASFAFFRIQSKATLQVCMLIGGACRLRNAMQHLEPCDWLMMSRENDCRIPLQDCLIFLTIFHSVIPVLDLRFPQFHINNEKAWAM